MKSALYYKHNSRRRLKKVVLTLVCIAVICIIIKSCFWGHRLSISEIERLEVPGWVDVQLIDINYAARRGEKLIGVNNIVVHYVGNPGTTAQQNRDYFDKNDTKVSSHFVVGLDGEVIQCVPLSEKSSASNDRNDDTISIEVCHLDSSGKFNDATYASLVKLTAWLVFNFNLDDDDVIRHYDITGKLCPVYYVKNEDAWEQFKADVAASKGEFR